MLIIKCNKMILFCGLIITAWLLSRIYPLFHIEPFSDWQIWEAKKLLEYGFLNRQGAIIDCHFMTGLVRNPFQFNYVNHPYPILWLYTGIYAAFGTHGLYTFALCISLTITFCVFISLTNYYSLENSFLSTLLFFLAPCTIIYSVDLNSSAVGYIVWPLVLLVVAQIPRSRQNLRAALVATIIFMGGQASWFIYTIVPALLIFFANPSYSHSKKITFTPEIRVLSAIVIASFLSIIIFAFQIWHYTPDFSAVYSYLSHQAGNEQSVPIGKMLLFIVFRACLCAGPALVMGCLLGLVLIKRNLSLNSLELSAIVYLLIFSISAVILRRYFYREIHLYEYLIFPLTILAASALKNNKSWFLRIALITFAVLGSLYPTLRASIPAASTATRELSSAIHNVTSPYDFVMTNLRKQESPYQSWDIASIEMTRTLADRLLKEDVDSLSKFEDAIAPFKKEDITIVFILDPAKPISVDLQNFLHKRSKSEKLSAYIPQESPVMALQIRTYYWKLMGKHYTRPSGAGYHDSKIEFEMYTFPNSKN